MKNKKTEGYLDPYLSEQPTETKTMEFLYGKKAREFLEHEALAEKELTEAARSFIEEKLRFEKRRPNKKEKDKIENSLVGASLKIPIGSILNQKPPEFEGPIMIGRSSPVETEGRTAARFSPWVHQARFEIVWQEIWSSWKKTRKKDQYRWPTFLNELNPGLGKKVGKEYGLPYSLGRESITVTPQKGFQFSLNFGSKLSELSSLDRERTQTLNDLLAAEGYGPEVTKNWHYVFWATQKSEDGSFSFNAAEWLDLFGYKRTGGGRNRKPRHPGSSVRAARKSFQTFANIELNGSLCGVQVKGKLLHNKELEITEPTESGGIKRQRYGVNEFLWRVVKNGPAYILFHPETVNAGGVHVDTNDKIIRILEVLYTHSRINATGERRVLSFRYLAEKTNMYTAKTDLKKARKDLWKKMEIAQSQGRLVNVQKTELKDGSLGFSYELPEEQKQNMQLVAEGRRKHSSKK